MLEFKLLDLEHSIHDIVVLIGYKSLGFRHNEFSLIRNITKGDYPRFHLLVKILNGGDRGHHFVLHLENSSRPLDNAHKNPKIEEEVKRIKDLLTKGLE